MEKSTILNAGAFAPGVFAGRGNDVIVYDGNLRRSAGFVVLERLRIDCRAGLFLPLSLRVDAGAVAADIRH